MAIPLPLVFKGLEVLAGIVGGAAVAQHKDELIPYLSSLPGYDDNVLRIIGTQMKAYVNNAMKAGRSNTMSLTDYLRTQSDAKIQRQDAIATQQPNAARMALIEEINKTQNKQPSVVPDRYKMIVANANTGAIRQLEETPSTEEPTTVENPGAPVESESERVERLAREAEEQRLAQEGQASQENPSPDDEDNNDEEENNSSEENPPTTENPSTGQSTAGTKAKGIDWTKIYDNPIVNNKLTRGVAKTLPLAIPFEIYRNVKNYNEDPENYRFNLLGFDVFGDAASMVKDGTEVGSELMHEAAENVHEKARARKLAKEAAEQKSNEEPSDTLGVDQLRQLKQQENNTNSEEKKPRKVVKSRK